MRGCRLSRTVFSGTPPPPPSTAPDRSCSCKHHYSTRKRTSRNFGGPFGKNPHCGRRSGLHGAIAVPCVGVVCSSTTPPDGFVFRPPSEPPDWDQHMRKSHTQRPALPLKGFPEESGAHRTTKVALATRLHRRWSRQATVSRLGVRQGFRPTSGHANVGRPILPGTLEASIPQPSARQLIRSRLVAHGIRRARALPEVARQGRPGHTRATHEGGPWLPALLFYWSEHGGSSTPTA